MKLFSLFIVLMFFCLSGCVHSYSMFYGECDISEADAYLYYPTKKGDVILEGLCFGGDAWL